jgi:hypothetical protein
MENIEIIFFLLLLAVLIDDWLLTHLESELDMLETHTARAELKSGVKEMSKHERGEG